MHVRGVHSLSLIRPPPGQQAATECLQQQHGAANTSVLLPLQPATDVFLDHDTAGTQLVRSQLLQVRHLPRAEEDLRLAEPVLVVILRRQR